MRQNSRKYLAPDTDTKWDTEGILLDESIAKAPVNLAEMFGNPRPVELEIGSGKGTFLLARAAARPELNFLGIEWARAYCHYTADRMKRHGLTNVRMLRADAGGLVHRCLPDASLLRMHIYFPDPWPKRKHHRRRLIQEPFVAQARRVLMIGGQLIIVTDHLDYFRQIQRVLSARSAGWARIPVPKMTGGDDELVGTNFERKYIAQGRAFYSAARLRYA